MNTLNKINSLISVLKNIDTIAGYYAKIGTISHLDEIKNIPVMDKDMLSKSIPTIRENSMSSGKRFHLVASGGTTRQPRYSCLPFDFDIDRIIENWKPLNTNDIYCNLFKPGKLWAGHNLFNTLGARLAGQTLSIGGIDKTELLTWCNFFNDQKVTAIAATPTTLKNILFFCKKKDIKLKYLSKFIWAGEAIDVELEKHIKSFYPKLETWGLYASMETWIIGLNKPSDKFNEFEIIKDKMVEIINKELIITELSNTAINAILRYKIGDSGEFVDSSKNRIRLFGRCDDSFNFKGQIFYPSDLIKLTNEVEGVLNSQIFLPHNEENEIIRIEVHFVSERQIPDEKASNEIAKNILQNSMDLDDNTNFDKNEIFIRKVESLKTIERTGKTYTVYKG